jgi:hypothetical protein
VLDLSLTAAVLSVFGLVRVVFAFLLVWGLGRSLIAVFTPSLAKQRTPSSVLSLLCGIVLCGFVTFIPARFVEAEGAFRAILFWFVPLLVLLLAGIVYLRQGRPRLRAPRIGTGALRAWPQWASAVLLIALTATVLLHQPNTTPTVELGGEQEPNSFRVDVVYGNSHTSPYTLRVTSPAMIEPMVTRFISPTSGTVSFEVPPNPDLTVELLDAEGNVLRRLHIN